MLVDVEKRAAVLAVASGFTSDRTNAAMVTENAGPLLAWLEEAGRETPSRRGCLWVIKLWRRLRKADAKADLDARAVAIWQHHLNLTAEEDDNEVVIDNPGEFLSGARALYCFLAGRGPESLDVDLDDNHLHAWMDGEK